ncbi:nitric oxide dioxygenase [Actinomadura coerulea]|uniref:nitric oxide dioxygenase n=1 Tax=Actinomadura coerulea TaxID=46159 RepID=A0A7X0KYH9_9ACTN|nr:globin domain-containing protein [Actinomadura coerulea]MBB6395432.1 nitric oxide dioxygenase [Actinomadura coerulea]GGQ46728.1 hemin transporter [Actinomadura coerulea]
MLSTDHAETVRATLPAVAANGTAITGEFYAAMFAAHPELRHLFNQGNQANGEQRRALAGSVAAFAGHLVTERSSIPFQQILSRIAHKHASLGIRPEQYTIVGRHLMDAVAKVLGDAVTPQVHAAWSEVYWLFATLLIAEEARLYQDASCDPAAPFRPWHVTERRDEAEDTVSLVLAPADGGTVPAHRPGQYVSLAVTLPDGLRQPRQYTLSRAAGGTVQITLRRVRGDGAAPDGAVSTFLFEHVGAGDVVELSPPFGDVVVEDDDAPLVLVSAGIGITPVAAMIDHLAAERPDRPVLAVHADRSVRTHALRRQIAEAGARMTDFRQLTWYEDVDGSRDARPGRIEVARLPLPPKARVFMCGPIPFMREVRRGLAEAGVSDERVHYEVFGPDLWNTGG